MLHGDGDHFSAGLDLSELRINSIEDGVRHSSSWHRIFNKMEFGQVPIVAVLHGAVVGGGLELAATAHVRIAERSTFYALPEGVRGIFVGGGGSVRVPRLIGTSRMMEMMLTGHVLPAEEGQALGLSHYLVGDGEGLAKALDLAGKIAKNSWVTNFGIIQALPRIAEQDPRFRLCDGSADGGDCRRQRGSQGARHGVPGEARAEGVGRSRRRAAWRSPAAKQI